MPMPTVVKVTVETGTTGKYFGVKIVHDDGSFDLLAFEFANKADAISLGQKEADRFGVSLAVD